MNINCNYLFFKLPSEYDKSLNKYNKMMYYMLTGEIMDDIYKYEYNLKNKNSYRGTLMMIKSWLEYFKL